MIRFSSVDSIISLSFEPEDDLLADNSGKYTRERSLECACCRSADAIASRDVDRRRTIIDRTP